MTRKRGPKGQFVKKSKSPKADIMAKARSMKKPSMSELQKEHLASKKMRDKPPTSSIMMHGSKYTLYDVKPRTKELAQKIRQKLKTEGMAAFINPRKRKSGTQWFIYQKPSEHAKARARKPTQQRVSKRTGIPTSSIMMHGKKYNLYDDKPRNKSEAQVIRTKLVNQGKSAFLNPRRRKSGTEYFVYEKLAERRRVKAGSSRKITPRQQTTKSQTIKNLEAELRRLKALK